MDEVVGDSGEVEGSDPSILPPPVVACCAVCCPLRVADAVSPGQASAMAKPPSSPVSSVTPVVCQPAFASLPCTTFDAQLGRGRS